MLYCTERGFVAPMTGEDVNALRNIRKSFVLQEDTSKIFKAELYVFASSYSGCQVPLIVICNDREIGRLEPDAIPYLHWHTIPVPVEMLQSGKIVVKLSTAHMALASWTVGLEGSCRQAGDSEATFDGGRTWSNCCLGYTHSMTGEYVIRLRTYSTSEDIAQSPDFIWENPDSEKLSALTQAIPSEIRDMDQGLDQVIALKSWVSGLWDYRNASQGGVVYTPWDPWTIMEWGSSGRGHGEMKPVCMCVHYAILFTMCCLALGIPSRNVVTAETLSKATGHFMSEVWCNEYDKWVLVDPQGDLMFAHDGKFLSMREVSDLGPAIKACIKVGEMTAKHRRRIGDVWFDDLLASGIPFRIWGIWFRNDYLSCPWECPPGHGQVGYCETTIHWFESCAEQEPLGMFPWTLGKEEYDAEPPEGFSAQRINCTHG